MGGNKKIDAIRAQMQQEAESRHAMESMLSQERERSTQLAASFAELSGIGATTSSESPMHAQPAPGSPFDESARAAEESAPEPEPEPEEEAETSAVFTLLTSAVHEKPLEAGSFAEFSSSAGGDSGLEAAMQREAAEYEVQLGLLRSEADDLQSEMNSSLAASRAEAV